MPIVDENGRRHVVMAEADVDEPMLRKIAETTGGEFFRATDTKSLEDVYARIDAMEKTTREVSHYERRDEKFIWALAPALLLVTLELGLASTLLRRVP
jgi:Ca-activated chloride channel family protein